MILDLNMGAKSTDEFGGSAKNVNLSALDV